MAQLGLSSVLNLTRSDIHLSFMTFSLHHMASRNKLATISWTEWHNSALHLKRIIAFYFPKLYKLQWKKTINGHTKGQAWAYVPYENKLSKKNIRNKNIKLNNRTNRNKPFSKPSLQDPIVELDWNTGNASSTEKGGGGGEILNTKQVGKTMHKISILENEQYLN